MKKLDFFFFMVLLGAIGMVGCTQQSSVSEPSEKSAEFEISISKADLLKSVSVAEGWYCPDELPEAGTATITYTVKVYDAADNVLAEIDEQTEQVRYEELNDEGQIQQKITLNWNDFYNGTQDVEYLTVTVTSVMLGETTGGYTFAAPNTETLYSSYIEEGYQVGKVWKVDLYEKAYIDVKVLCFNKQDIPKFGFSWFDFEIFTGEEVCVYFNCLTNELDIDDNRIHDNVETNYSASFFAGLDQDDNEIWSEYWTDGVEGATYALNCIPLPANYADKGIKIQAGIKEVEVTDDDIEAFLDQDTNYSRTVADYEVYVDTDGSAYFLHFVFENCTY